MQNLLYKFELNPVTWAYLSSLITIAVYFKFRRFWSVRNLDLLGLLLYAPGLLMVSFGLDRQNAANPRAAELVHAGYAWLFMVTGLFLVRTLVDSAMVRRPLLEPNLSVSGLTFSCAAMLVFLMANVITPSMKTSDVEGAQSIDKMVGKKDYAGVREEIKKYGPGYPLFQLVSVSSNDNIPDNTDPNAVQRAFVRVAFTRTMAIAAHLAIVLAMVLIGYRHFDNMHTGIAAATLYLLMPYTAEYTPRIDHVVPGALLVWAIQSYRRPVLAGVLIGLVSGLICYPLFLLPLWCSFYWRRGLFRFLIGVFSMLVLVALSLLITADRQHIAATFLADLFHTFGPDIVPAGREVGFWELPRLSAFRLTVFAGFAAMCISLAIWPAQKNLGSLLACTTAIILATQFWKPYEGGTYLGWYLPLLILTIFRPNLEDRVALSAISEGWLRGRSK
jgi:hypothetical protein